MCCNFIQGANCEWVQQGEFTKHVSTTCALRTSEEEIDNQRDEDGKSTLMFRGNVTKPLHTMTDGLWEVKFTMLDGFGSSIGRVIAHVMVHPSDLQPIGGFEGTAMDLTTATTANKTEKQTTTA